MAEQESRPEPQVNDNRVVSRLIPVVGIVLVLGSIVLVGSYPATVPTIASGIALFGIGCATIWFSYIHPAVTRGEERIEQINKSVDRVRQRITRRQK